MKRHILNLVLAAALTLPGTAALAAEGDAEVGAKVFKKCKACHSLEEGKNKVGPHLAGIVGRDAGVVEGYKYSKAMREAEAFVWDEASIDTFLTKPKAFLKGTKMSFAGLKKEGQRADVIAYLKSLQE